MLRVILSLLLIPTHVICSSAAADEKCVADNVQQAELKLQDDVRVKARLALITTHNVMPVPVLAGIISDYCGTGFSIKELLALGYEFQVETVEVDNSHDEGPDDIRTNRVLDLSGLRLSSIEGIEQIPNWRSTTDLILSNNSFAGVSSEDWDLLCDMLELKLLVVPDNIVGEIGILRIAQGLNKLPECAHWRAALSLEDCTLVKESDHVRISS